MSYSKTGNSDRTPFLSTQITDATLEKLHRAQADILEEYTNPSHNNPWIVGFSGGKDSTLVLQLVLEAVLSLAPSERKRPIHVVTNDTLVESPVLMSFIHKMLAKLRQCVDALRLPLVVKVTTPPFSQSFWVNLIGRGYPSPSRAFRWCTDRMKIQPTSDYIHSTVSASGQVILLLGVRRDESATRARSVDRYTNPDGSRLNPHNDLKGCMVFRPISDFLTEEVWALLLQRPPPWGGTHRELWTLYRNAQGGECPLVLDADSAPSCGSSSSRFGCWTCTVVEKDKSSEGFIDAGYDHLEPLMLYRDWLREIRNDPTRRMVTRRTGKVQFMRDGTLIPGPFTLAARQEMLDRLLALEKEVDMPLISPEEVQLIHQTWSDDILKQVQRERDGSRSKGSSLLTEEPLGTSKYTFDEVEQDRDCSEQEDIDV